MALICLCPATSERPPRKARALHLGRLSGKMVSGRMHDDVVTTASDVRFLLSLSVSRSLSLDLCVLLV